jgi:hypothetical protein
MPFFPRILVHLVGLGSGVPQRVAIQPDPGALLEPMPEVQQVHAVTAQLAGQLRRRDALGDAAKDQDDRRGAPLHPLEGRPGPGVEDAMAPAALVIEHRGAMAAVDAEPFLLAAAWASQTAGVEHGEELGVAGILIHQVGEREVHGGSSPGEEGDDRIRPEPGVIVNGPGTSLAS